MQTNRLLLVTTLAMLPTAIGCDQSAESTPTADTVSVKQGAIVVTGLGELTWTLPSYADPLRVPLIALNELKINDRARTFTPEHLPGAVANVGVVQTNIGVDAVVGQMNSVADVFLRERAKVEGSLTTAGTLSRQNGTSVQGTISERAAMQRGTLGLSLQFGPSTVDVMSNATPQPAPGRYRTMVARAGAPLTLRTGVYKVDHFIVDPQQRVFVDSADGPVIVLATMTFIMQGKAEAATGGGFPGWVVGFAGTADVYVGSQLDGTFFAPNAKVNMSIGDARHTGMVVARNIELHQGGQFIHHPFPEGIRALRKLFGLQAKDVGDCPFAVPMIGIGRNGNDPISLLSEDTPRVFGFAGFNPLHELATGWENEVQATAMAWGDFDGDCQEELAVGRSAHDGGRLLVFDDADHQMVMFNNGNLLTDLGSGFGVSAVAAGDIDGDGLDEIAVGTNFDDEGRPELFILDDQKHGFARMRQFDVGNRRVNDLKFGDADNDGEIDLLVARDGREDSGAGRIVVIRGPQRNWAQSELANDWGNSPRHATAVAIGDLDGDGKNEIAVGRDAGDNGRVLMYRFENGGFRKIADFGREWGLDRQVTALAFADVDGNSAQGAPPNHELIVGRNGTCGGCTPGPRVLVFDEPINSALQPITVAELAGNGTWDETRGVQSLAAGDVDFDGKAEIVVGRTTGDNARVIVFDDAEGGFGVMHEIGHEWGSNRNARSLAVSKQIVCQSKLPAPVPATVNDANAQLPARRDAAIRYWLKGLMSNLQATSGEPDPRLRAPAVFGAWGTGAVHDATRRILAGAAAIKENLDERQDLLNLGFVDLMNRYIIENVTMYKDVGTAADFDFDMMELLEIMHYLEPLEVPNAAGVMVKMLTNPAIDALSLRGKLDNVIPPLSALLAEAFADALFIFPSVIPALQIPYSGNDVHHLLDEITIAGIPLGFSTPETENHVLMIHTWSYLINQWVAERRRGIGPTLEPASVYVNEGSKLERFLLAALGRFLKNGSWETNARPYQAFTVRAIQLLASYAKENGKVQSAAKNALDTLAAKYAFQSLHSKRTPPMRRNVKNRGKNGIYQNDYIASSFGILSGATVFDTSAQCVGRMCAYYENQQPGFGLDAVLMRYRLPSTIHDLMLRPDNHQPGYGAWARMHDKFTERHYLANTRPRYPLPNALDQPDLSGEPVERQAEFYFITGDYMNSSGGRTEHYGAGDFLPDEIFGQSLFEVKYGTDFWAKPTALVGNRDLGYWTVGAGTAQETLVSSGLGTYKNFVYGSPVVIPDHWPVAAIATLGDATFRVIDPSSTRSVFVNPGYYLVVGFLPGNGLFMGTEDHGLWEVIPKDLFPNAQAVLDNVLLVNAGNPMNKMNAYAYTLTVSGERMSLNPLFSDFTAIDGSSARVDEVHLKENPAGMPLMDVRQVDSHYRFTTKSYVCATGDGRVIVNNPYLHSQLVLDSRNHQEPSRQEMCNVQNVVDPCNNGVPVDQGIGGSNGAGSAGCAATGAGGTGGAGGTTGTGGATGTAGTGGASAGLSTQLTIDSSWATGYCVTIKVTNNSTQPTTNYAVTLNMQGATITSNRWNGNFSGSTGTVTVTPLSWHAVITPGQTDSQMGFCADRVPPNTLLATVVSTTGTF